MKLNNLIFTALAGFSIILAGCQNNDENEQHYDNKLFISASNFTKEILFKAGDTNVETGLSVAIAKPEEHDIKVTMSPAPELLSTYKLAYSMKLQYFFLKNIIQCQKLRLPSNQLV